MKISFRSTGHKVWKYKTEEVLTYVFRSDLEFWETISLGNEYIDIDQKAGRTRLRLPTGYAWNGLTGFPDLWGALPASLVHDALLGENAKREDALNTKKALRAIHRVFYDVLREDNGWMYSRFLYNGVRLAHPISRKFSRG